MNKSAFYLGIDVGSREVVVAMEGHRPRPFAHSAKGIKAMVDWARTYAGSRDLHFCMEATGVYSCSVATRLSQDHQVAVSIINPAQISSFAAAQLRRAKTDSVDAQVILAFAQSQQPPLWQPDTAALRKLYHLTRLADQLKEALRQWHNRKHAQSYLDDIPVTVQKAERRIERSLARELARVEAEIIRLCREETILCDQVKLLSTIPGVAFCSATHILAFGRDLFFTRDRKALVAYAGLAPGQKQSGTSVRGKSRIVKRGNQHLRRALYMPAVVASQHNPVLKPLYERLLQKGKPKMLALTAVMKKLLLMIQAILRTNKPFDPNIALDR